LTAVISPSPAAAVRPRRLPRDLVSLTRPDQWLKNLVVPIPLLLAASWTTGDLVRVVWATVLFTVAAALVYVGNDIADAERDRAHPVKCLRPIADCRVTVPVATVFAAGLAGALVLLIAGHPVAEWWPVAAYLVINVAYSFRLKHLPLVDVFTVASGFVLRLVLGFAAVREPAPIWLVVCVLCLCLLLGFGKRRAELATGAKHRPALAGYTMQLLEQLILLNAVLVLTSYLLYLNGEAPVGPYAYAAVLVSTPFGLFAVFRYLQVLLVDRGGGDPVKTLVRDRAMVVDFLLWGVFLGLTVAAARYPGTADAVLDRVG
jgi:decaprenyl-phosphate phosphoribosyltransferase